MTKTCYKTLYEMSNRSFKCGVKQTHNSEICTMNMLSMTHIMLLTLTYFSLGLEIKRVHMNIMNVKLPHDTHKAIMNKSIDNNMEYDILFTRFSQCCGFIV